MWVRVPSALQGRLTTGTGSQAGGSGSPSGGTAVTFRLESTSPDILAPLLAGMHGGLSRHRPSVRFRHGELRWKTTVSEPPACMSDSPGTRHEERAVWSRCLVSQGVPRKTRLEAYGVRLESGFG